MYGINEYLVMTPVSSLLLVPVQETPSGIMLLYGSSSSRWYPFLHVALYALKAHMSSLSLFFLSFSVILHKSFPFHSYQSD